MIRFRFSLVAGLLVGLSLTTSSTFAAEDLTLVSSDSTIEFVGTKPGGKHKGGFQKFKVDASADFEDPNQSSIAVEIDAKSIWSDDDKLTNHLKSPDFFDVRNNPKITFESTKIVPGERNGDKLTATITGDWMMLGKTVKVEIPVEAEVTEQTIDMTAKFTIDRTKWGMNYGQGKIDNDVKVSVRLFFKR